jgi:hypothetical protein
MFEDAHINLNKEHQSTKLFVILCGGLKREFESLCIKLPKFSQCSNHHTKIGDGILIKNALYWAKLALYRPL